MVVFPVVVVVGWHSAEGAPPLPPPLPSPLLLLLFLLLLLPMIS